MKIEVKYITELGKSAIDSDRIKKQRTFNLQNDLLKIIKAELNYTLEGFELVFTQYEPSQNTIKKFIKNVSKDLGKFKAKLDIDFICEVKN